MSTSSDQWEHLTPPMPACGFMISTVFQKEHGVMCSVHENNFESHPSRCTFTTKTKRQNLKKLHPWQQIGNSGDPLNGRVYGFSKTITFAPTATNQPH